MNEFTSFLPDSYEFWEEQYICKNLLSQFFKSIFIIKELYMFYMKLWQNVDSNYLFEIILICYSGTETKYNSLSLAHCIESDNNIMNFILV